MTENQKMDQKLDTLRSLRQQSEVGGGEDRLEAQHRRGKLSARERLYLLFDQDTFEEIDPFSLHRSRDFGLENQRYLGDAVITGYGLIDGRTTFAYSQDFTVLGGSLSEAVGKKICKVMDLASKTGAPMVGLIDSGGARIQEGILSLAGYADIFVRNVRNSGVIPQISVILGPAAGGATYSPALTDFIFMVNGTGQMYITGPDVIKAVTGETVTHETLGGAETHASKSGVSHFTYDSEENCISGVRKLLTFLPGNNLEDPPKYIMEEPDENSVDILQVVPDSPNMPYNMLDIIKGIVDSSDYLEVQKDFAKNITIGFARMGGQSIGVVGQQPEFMAGVLDINASVKAARFVRFCDAFNIPVLTLVDVPGFMPGTEQEYNGIIRHGAKLIFAYAEATVPKICLLIRKAYGGAYIVMSSKGLLGDINLSWPTGEIAVMGAEGAVNIIYRNEIRESEDPEALRAKLISEYETQLINPYIAAAHGLIDDVIVPTDTREKIIKGLNMLSNKRETLSPKKHGSIPL